MATNKMKLRHLYRSGEHKFLEDNYGVVFTNKDLTNNEILQRANNSIKEHEEIEIVLKEEENKVNDESLLEKMEYLNTLDMSQLKVLVRGHSQIPHKLLIKMKKEELISELLK